MSDEQFALIIGNVIAGFRVAGPFISIESAEKWVKENQEVAQRDDCTFGLTTLIQPGGKLEDRLKGKHENHPAIHIQDQAVREQPEKE